MNDDLLEVLQADIFAILKNTPSLALANVLADNDGDLENRVLKALKTLTPTGGKMGLAVVVLLPEVTTAESNLPGPPLQIECEIRVIEQVLINRGANGSLKRSSQAALCVLGALHHQLLGSHALYAEKDPVRPVEVKAGYVSHAVKVFARSNGVTGPGKPASVSADYYAGLLHLACGTAATTIYYTTDGSYPEPTAGTEYTAPLAGLQVGTLIRAAAYATGMNPGDVIGLNVT